MTYVSRVQASLKLAGIDLPKVSRNLTELPWFIRSYRTYREQSADLGHSLQPKLLNIVPMLNDRGESAGTLGGQYFHQDLWAAREIFQRRPSRHVDVGSRIDGFVGHLLTFMPVEVVDIRPLDNDVEGLTARQANAEHLEVFETNSEDSISSLHAVEHFGLGRYGDPINPNACFNAMRALARVLRPGGRLYLSVPVGRERVCFNAHRIFSPHTVLNTMKAQGLELIRLASVNDQGKFVPNCTVEEAESYRFGLGLFEFTKNP